jgi:amino acid transporter
LDDSPVIGSFHFVADLPALLIIVLITGMIYRGMKESRNASNYGGGQIVYRSFSDCCWCFYVDTANWDPFAPNGVVRSFERSFSVFFAYIGFDAISTTAEECKDPQRDLPRGMMWAIIICTVLLLQ